MNDKANVVKCEHLEKCSFKPQRPSSRPGDIQTLFNNLLRDLLEWKQPPVFLAAVVSLNQPLGREETSKILVGSSPGLARI